ncbi:MAG: acyl--CoA ligase, partial [Gammaproteobacteria bacterium]|nr:acyl--CoA ligase [Gammaproteobacteria bacterium]
MTRDELVNQLTAPGMRHELVEIVQNGQTCKVFKNAPLTIRQMLEEGRLYGDRTYLQYEEEQYSFAEVFQIVCSLSHALVSEYGIKKGDRVAIAMRNYPEWVLSYMAIVSVGGIAVALNSWWNTHEMAYGLTDCGARVVFADQERMDIMADLVDSMELTVVAVRATKPLSHRCVPWEALTSDGSKQALPEVVIEPTDDAAILYTSGSTGHPKGAVSTHRAILHAIISWELDRYCGLARLQEKIPPETDPDFIPSILMAVPLFHVSGSHVGMLSFLRNGGKMVLMYRWDVMKAMDIIEQQQIKQFTAVPTMTGDLVQAAKASGRRLSSLLAVGGGGASRDPAQVKAIANDLETAAPG